MRDDGDVRSVLQTLGSAAVGLGLGVGILTLGFVVSRLALAESSIASVATGTPPPTPARTATPPSTAPTVAPGPTTPAPTATPVPTPSPTPTPDPLVATAFQGQGLDLAALTVPAGYTLRAPIDGVVRIVLYQYLGGEIRTDSHVASEPTYPYVFLTSADREVKIRPGAVDRDVELLVRDGQTVATGTPLLRTKTTGASSWRVFYDDSVTAQVVVSLSERPSAGGLDPLPLFKK